MSAEIFNPPSEIKVPKLDFANYNRKTHSEANDKFLDELSTFLKENGGKGKNIGEIIAFPVGDGAARYMVASMRPLQLVHIPLDDAWNFPQAHLLTAKEVNSMIESDKAMAKLFS